MFDPGARRDHLALEKRTATVIVTVLSLAALAGATFYILGFFAPIEWSLISLLTVQDQIIIIASGLPSTSRMKPAMRKVTSSSSEHLPTLPFRHPSGHLRERNR